MTTLVSSFDWLRFVALWLLVGTFDRDAKPINNSSDTTAPPATTFIRFMHDLGKFKRL
jgi:hypothetical protein